MQATFLIVLLCALGAVLAYPQPFLVEEEQLPQLYEAFEEDSPVELSRVRRQLTGGGGGSLGQGFDLSLQGRAPVWQSDNGRHSLDATAQYSQHLGGPYGNSRPNFGGGGVYTYRF